MARALNPDREIGFVLKEDRELAPAEQTVWYFRTLSAADHARIQDAAVLVEQDAPQKGFRNATTATRTRILSGSQPLEVLLAGLVRVDNFLDDQGRAIPYPGDGKKEAKLAFLSRLKPAWRREIADAISGETELSEEEEGNSASPSGSQAPGTAGNAAETTKPALAATAA